MSNQSRGSLESALLATNRGGMKSPTWLGPDQLDVDVPVVLAEDDLRVAAMTGRAAEEELARLQEEQRRAELNYAIVRVEADEAIKALEESRTATASAVGLFAGSKAEHEKAVRCILAVAKNEDPDGEALGYLLESGWAGSKGRVLGDTLLHFCMLQMSSAVNQTMSAEESKRLNGRQEVKYYSSVVEAVVSADPASISIENASGKLPIEEASSYLMDALTVEGSRDHECLTCMLSCAKLCHTGGERSGAALCDIEIRLGVKKSKLISESKRNFLLTESIKRFDDNQAELESMLEMLGSP